MDAQPIILSDQAIKDLPDEGFSAANSQGGDVTWKTLFSSSTTPTNTLTSGLAKCSSKGGQLKCHRHAHAEMYYITQGRGIVTIDGKEEAVSNGSVVFIPGDAEHGVRNEDDAEDLIWLYVFAADRFEDIEYRFSPGKSPQRSTAAGPVRVLDHDLRYE